MKFVRVGVILNVERYAECVAFYRDVFGLSIMHQKDQGDFKLTCFAFGEAYLMVEMGGRATDGEKTVGQSPHKLRFHVDDVQQARRELLAKGLDVQVESFDWGEVINLCDPDGNRIGIRDEAGFEG